MADNFKALDAQHQLVQFRSRDNGGIQTPLHQTEQPSALLHGQNVAAAVAAAIGAGNPRHHVRVRCLAASPEPIYLGAAGVTVLTGYPLWPGTSVELHIDDLASLFVVSALGTGTYAYIGS